MSNSAVLPWMICGSLFWPVELALSIHLTIKTDLRTNATVARAQGLVSKGKPSVLQILDLSLLAIELCERSLIFLCPSFLPVKQK